MNLIRITLLIILMLQLSGLLYVRVIYKEDKSKNIETTHHIMTINQNRFVVTNTPLPISTEYTDNYAKKPLPISTEYTDNHNEHLIKIAKHIPKLENDDFSLVKLGSKLSNSKEFSKKYTKVKKIKVIKKIIKIAKAKTKQKDKLIVKVYKKINKEITLSNKIENYAKKLLGKKYVWGATGPKCYDCSGFTQKVYRKVAGIKLPRVSYLQAKVGKRISFNKLEQGDMVFFDTEKKPTGRVNHVGIYLRNGNFIHASSGGKKVIITNFNKKRFYKNHFLWGRRVINSSKKIAINKSIKINSRYKN